VKRTILSLACIFLLFFPLGADDAPVFTSVAEGSLVIAAEEVWYLEEHDVSSRPVSATLWKKGAIAERTSWLYERDSQSPAMKIITGADGSTETSYDTAGNITRVTATDLRGDAASKLENTWNTDNLLAESVLTEGKSTTRMVYEYDADKKLREKKRYENGDLAVVYRYESDDNWTETVYSKSQPVFTATYVDGVRMKDADEKKY